MADYTGNVLSVYPLLLSEQMAQKAKIIIIIIIKLNKKLIKIINEKTKHTFSSSLRTQTYVYILKYTHEDLLTPSVLIPIKPKPSKLRISKRIYSYAYKSVPMRVCESGNVWVTGAPMRV